MNNCKEGLEMNDTENSKVYDALNEFCKKLEEVRDAIVELNSACGSLDNNLDKVVKKFQSLEKKENRDECPECNDTGMKFVGQYGGIDHIQCSKCEGKSNPVDNSKGNDDTEHLLKSEANKEWLMESIEQSKDNDSKEG
jgi:hypothetical protein